MSKEHSKAAVSDWLEMAIGGSAKQSEAENKTRERKSHTTDSSQQQDIILEIDPNQIERWKFKDRPDNELGDIDSLAEEMAGDIGQLQPCLVRHSETPEFSYELIVGERRWRAAMKKGIALKVIVQDIDDKLAALAQAAENKDRESLSEYAQGMSLAKLIAEGVVREVDLIDQLNLSKATVNRLLSFAQIPDDIWQAVQHPQLVSARTASEMRAYLNKGNEYREIILKLAPRIGTGKFGSKQLQRAVESFLAEKTEPLSAKEVYSKSGQHLFTWRKDSNSKVSISFPKTIRTRISREKLEEAIQREIEAQLVAENE